MRGKENRQKHWLASNAVISGKNRLLHRKKGDDNPDFGVFSGRETRYENRQDLNILLSKGYNAKKEGSNNKWLRGSPLNQTSS
jgi:hypothetical protein